ncbi:MAG: Pyridoxamine 5'-phosphate oxidase family protein [Pseudoclavibacter caeni]|jgi:uncharacterized protein
MADNDTIITEMPVDEAWRQLGSAALGHIAFVIDGAPEIFPINYAVDGHTVLLRTAPGTKLFGITVNPRVAIETEQYDATTGWSVIAKGTAEVLTDDAALDAADEAGLRPWVPTIKENVVRIAVDEITGRRFRFGPEPESVPEGAA